MSKSQCQINVQCPMSNKSYGGFWKLKFGVLLVIGILSLGFLSGCATSYDAKGRFYKVQPGDTIWKIAKFYRVPVQDLAELNNVQDGYKIEAGSKLYIPKRAKRESYKRFPSPKERIASAKKAKEEVKDEPIQTDRGKFIWPVDGAVLFSQFGIRDGRRHDGIDLSAPTGTPIKAAADGRVAYSGKLSGYGNAIIVRHSGNFFTVYAHNSKNNVKKGEKVKKGEVIALVGQTGRATGPHCHFEIRNGQKARNPLFFLPVKESANETKVAKKKDSGKKKRKQNGKRP